MPATDVGINLAQTADKSFLKLRRHHLFAPRAADVQYVVANVDPSGVAAGAALTLAAAASGLLIRSGRIASISITDASGGGGGLAATITVTGSRFGIAQSEDISATATSGAVFTTSGLLIFDEVTGVVLKSKTSDAAGDVLSAGINGASFGLLGRIKAVSSVKQIVNVSTNTEATSLVPSSSNVDVTNSAIKGITLAATDRWEVLYETDGEDGYGTFGAWHD